MDFFVSCILLLWPLELPWSQGEGGHQTHLVDIPNLMLEMKCISYNRSHILQRTLF